MKFKCFSILSILILFSSCGSFKKQSKEGSDLNYMQNIEQVATDTSIKKSNHTIQVGDQLVILITAKDGDVARPFNQNYSSGEMVASNNSTAGGNISNAGATTISGPTYIVDGEGNIDFPVVGKLRATGKTMIDLKEELRSKLTKYIIDPTVNIRLSNFKITVLGEVNKQGDYIVSSGQATIFNALGLAGDLTMYGRRDNILIVRNIDGEITKARIDLKDANFINSPYFNLKQGDVVYVSSNETKEKTAKLDPKIGIYLSVAGVAIAVAGIIVTVFKK